MTLHFSLQPILKSDNISYKRYHLVKLHSLKKLINHNNLLDQKRALEDILDYLVCLRKL